jgi:hypothetical protein
MKMFFHRYRIARLISILGRAVTGSERANGWTEATKKRTKTYFQNILKRLRLKQKLPALDIVRSLDHDGVAGGSLLERIAKIANELRRVAKRQAETAQANPN